MAGAPRHGVHDDLEPGDDLLLLALGAGVHHFPRPSALGPPGQKETQNGHFNMSAVPESNHSSIPTATAKTSTGQSRQG